MRRLFLVLLPLVGLLACRRPEVEAFERKPLPIAVSFKVSPAYPRSEDLAKEYADALRARLATRVMVIPAGVPAPHLARPGCMPRRRVTGSAHGGRRRGGGHAGGGGSGRERAPEAR